MKVCDVVINSVWHDPRVRKQIAEYLRRGMEVVAVGLKCPRHDEEKVASMPCKTTVVQIDSRYDGKQHNVFRKLKRTYLRYRVVRDAIVAEKPDVIHANDLNALLPAFAAARKLKCKLIYDSHEVWVENNFFKNPLIKWGMRTAERYMVKRADRMVCVSHAAAEYFSKLYKIPMPMVVTNCSLEKEMIDPITVQKNPGFEVLNHGQFYAERGFEQMIEACPLLKAYPEIRMAIRGFGLIEKQLHDMADKLENKEQVLFYPPVTVQELIPVAAKSHVGVAVTVPFCLNFKLSISNRLFEYASAGLPVIMSDIPEHRYLNEKYEFGIVLQDNSPEVFADAVIRLYEDKALYQKLAENALKMSREVNWEQEFSRLIEAEEALLKG